MPSLSLGDRIHAGQPPVLFALSVALVFLGEALGYGACCLLGYLPSRPLAWAILAAAALIVGGVGWALLDWLLLERCRRMSGEIAGLRHGATEIQNLELQLASRAEQQRRLRHDIRGALSPALLTADRLINHADPAVRRAGDIMVRSVDRAASLLADPAELQPSLPDGP